MAGVKSNVAVFAAKMQRAGSSIPGAERAGLFAASQAARASILATATSAGAKPKGSWVGYKIIGTRSVVDLRSARAYWAERGTKAHDIKPKRAKAILTPQGPRASAHVRGVPAKHFWAPGTAAARPVAAKAHQDAVVAALRTALR